MCPNVSDSIRPTYWIRHFISEYLAPIRARLRTLGKQFFEYFKEASSCGMVSWYNSWILRAGYSSCFYSSGHNLKSLWHQNSIWRQQLGFLEWLLIPTDSNSENYEINARFSKNSVHILPINLSLIIFQMLFVIYFIYSCEKRCVTHYTFML